MKKTYIVLLLVISIIVIGSVLFFWLGWNTYSDEIKASLNSNPIIEKHIGNVNEIAIDLAATGNETNDDVFVFTVEGSKNTGLLKVEIEPGSLSYILSGTIELPSGEIYDLIPQTNATLDEKIAYGTPLLANGDSSESFTNKSEQKRSSLDPENQKKMGMEEIKERIFQAASNGNAKNVNLLLMKGANVNTKKSKTGATLLHTASLRGHIDVVELLISKGANVNSTNNKGQTPLSYAISRNHLEIVDLLKKNGGQATEELKESTNSK